MSLDSFRKLVETEQLICPKCKNPVKQFEKYVQSIATVWDGAGDSLTEDAGAIATLICANEGCDWKERTEYWDTYMKD